MRASGTRLLGALDELVNSNQRVSIYAANESLPRRLLDWFAPKTFPVNVSGPCEYNDGIACPGAGGYGIRIDPGWSKGKMVNGETRLVHEAGHVYAWLTGVTDSDANKEQSVRTENDYRSIRGCNARPNHETTVPHATSDPPHHGE